MTPPNEVKLLPCLSCGCGRILTHFFIHGKPTYHKIWCADCPLNMDFESSNKEQAIERWNTRTPSQPSSPTWVKDAVEDVISHLNKVYDAHLFSTCCKNEVIKILTRHAKGKV